MRYLLKVFSGPHVGAEVVLPQGETVIGSSDECDVVLDDRLIAGKHVAVNVADELIECWPVGKQAVLVDGKPIERAAIRPYQYFTIGTTHLAVGPADRPWPQLDFSDYQLREPPEEAVEVDTSDADTDESNSTASETNEHRLEGEPEKTRRLPLAFLLVLLIVGVNAVVFLGVIAASWAGTSDTVDIAATKTELQRAVKPYAPHVAVEGDDMRLQLVGFVPTETDRESLLRAARKACASVNFKVRSTESLLNSTRAQLKHDGYEGLLTAHALEPGVISINGSLHMEYHGALQHWEATEDRIERDVPLKHLVVNIDAIPQKPITIPQKPITFPQKPITFPQKAITMPQKPITFPQRPITVVFPQPEQTVVEVPTEKPKKRVPVPPPNLAKPNTNRADPLPILDVRIAHDKVVTLVDGRQVSIGGRLPNGLWVESLDLDHAVARTYTGQRLIVPFGFGG